MHVYNGFGLSHSGLDRAFPHAAGHEAVPLPRPARLCEGFPIPDRLRPLWRIEEGGMLFWVENQSQ